MDPIPEKTGRKLIDELFHLGLLIKGLGSILELFAGVGALFLTTNSVLAFAQFLVQGTLALDPSNLFANYILDFAAGYRPIYTNLILFAYLAGHAVLNLFLVIMLLRKKMWAYPLSLAIYCVIVAYEMWEVYLSWSLSLGVFTAFDLVVIALIYQEYEYMKKKRR